jgi:hypothetical protein
MIAAINVALMLREISSYKFGGAFRRIDAP